MKLAITAKTMRLFEAETGIGLADLTTEKAFVSMQVLHGLVKYGQLNEIPLTDDEADKLIQAEMAKGEGLTAVSKAVIASMNESGFFGREVEPSV